jgi:hypothetical protein
VGDDIVDRLSWYCRCGLDNHGHLLLQQARNEIARLRVVGDALAAAVRAGDSDTALAAWEQARRG